MPEYLSPGVYVEEVDAGPKPIAGVSTSTAGAVGVTARGPSAGKPVLVTSFADYVRTFGGYLAEPASALANKWNLDADEGGQWWRFPLSVRGFFDNGGQRLYIKRVVSATAVSASAALGQGLVVKLAGDAASGATSVKLESLIGIQEGTSLSFYRGDTQNPVPGSYTVSAYDSTARTVTFAPGLPQALAKGRDFVELAPRQSQSGNTTLRFEARDKGAWGNQLYVHTRPIVGATYNILADPGQGAAVSTSITQDLSASATVIDVDATTGFSAPGRVVIAGREYGLSNVNAAQKRLTLVTSLGQTVSAGTAVKWLRAANPVAISTTLANAAAVSAPSVTVASAAGIQDGDTVLIGADLHTVSNLAGNQFDVSPVIQNAHAVGTAVTTRASSLYVWGASGLYPGAIVELDNGEHKDRRVVSATSGNQVTLTGAPAGLGYDYYEGHKLRVIEAEVIVEYREGNTVIAPEAFTNLRLKNDGSKSYLVEHINQVSKLVTVKAVPPAQGGGFSETNLDLFPTAASGTWQKASGGDDKLGELSTDDFVGQDGPSGKRTGIVALEDIDEISICMAPGMWAGTIHSQLIQHCELLKDRFAVLDPKDGLDIEGIRAFREPFDTSYAALYYPWLNVPDPLTKKNVAVAPSAHMVGIYARSDVERGVHKAPANEVVRGIDIKQGFAQDVTKRQQDMLNPKGINALRFFPGRGHRVWGARTLSSDASWKYINVRRLFLFIEESIDEGTQWVVFEPNDEPLWARVRQTITNFLTTQWRNGALQGATADEAFFVKCDRTTMTQDDIDNGKLICVIGIAPVKPAEFVIFRIQHKTPEQSA